MDYLAALTAFVESANGNSFSKAAGRQFYKRFMKEIPFVIADQALVVFEIGWTQGNAVKDMFHRFFPDADVRVKKDLNGKDRIVCAVIEQHR